MEAPPPWTDPHAQEGGSQDVHAGCGPDLRIMEPADERQRYIIDMLASYVLKDGCDLEQVGTEFAAEFLLSHHNLQQDRRMKVY